MSLDFAASTTSRANCIANTPVNNIFAGGGTAMAWAKSTSTAIVDPPIISKPPGPSWSFYVTLTIDDTFSPINSVTFEHNTDTGLFSWHTDTQTYLLNTQYHVAVTFSKDNINNTPTIYINGVAKTVTKTDLSGTVFVDDSASTLRFGNSQNGGDHWSGPIEDVRLYNRILTAGEIKTIYYAKGSDSIVRGLKGRWPFQERSSGVIASGNNSVKDISGFGTHATPLNSATYGDNITATRRRLV